MQLAHVQESADPSKTMFFLKPPGTWAPEPGKNGLLAYVHVPDPLHDVGGQMRPNPLPLVPRIFSKELHGRRHTPCRQQLEPLAYDLQNHREQVRQPGAWQGG